MSDSRGAEEAASGRLLLPDPPPRGGMIELAEGILWGRLSMPFMLGHVNVYALEESDGWTLVDTGVPSETCREEWRGLLSGVLAGRPVRRLICTHAHADHMGLAGWLMRETGAELWAPRAVALGAYAMSRARWSAPPPEIESFFRGLGYEEAILAPLLERVKEGYGHLIGPMPVGFRALIPGEEIRLAGRVWRVSLAQGHAADQLLLTEAEGRLLIGGDAILPDNPAPLMIYPPEPDADPVREFLLWAAAAAPLLPREALVLPGHDLPFRDPRAGLELIVERDRARSEKLLAAMIARGAEGPGVRAVDVFKDLFRRGIGPQLYELAASQAIAHLRHLEGRGLVARAADAQGAWRFRVTEFGLEGGSGAKAP